jgi:hypothetical protein
MASEKKRRKDINRARKTQQTRKGPFRHPDGDRRRRGGMTVEQALAQKRALQQYHIEVPADSEEEE